MEHMGKTVHSVGAPWAVRTICSIVSGFDPSRELLVANLPEDVGHFSGVVAVPDL